MVPNGDVIQKIDINGEIFIKIILKNIYMSKKEVYILGRNITDVIEKECEIDETLRNLRLLTIYLFSNEKYITFYYIPYNEEEEWIWYFTGDLGDGKDYTNKPLEQISFDE